jgi:hypothetical protein
MRMMLPTSGKPGHHGPGTCQKGRRAARVAVVIR